MTPTRTPILLAMWIVAFLVFFFSGFLNKTVDFFLTIGILYALLLAWCAEDIAHWVSSL